MTLFEIDQQILACVDLETGEIIDPEKLEALTMERTQKIENVALWIKNLESDAIALKAQKDAFAERESAVKRRIESLKSYLVKATGGEKFATTMCAVNFRKSVKTEITDPDSVPVAYLKTKTEPDVSAIRDALKAGYEISGCRLVENLNAQVK